MAFLDENYLLTSPLAHDLYDEIAALPILDPHNHCDVKALAEDRGFTDIWDAEGATDHYVWELERKCGVPEELITGKTTDNHAKWLALAGVFDLFAGNPTYEWIHLDLKRRLGIDLEINAENAEVIWQSAQAKLSTPEYSPQSLILAMNVEAMCSTDDPADTLEHHVTLASSRLAGRVRPTFRPDAAMNIEKTTWNAYVDHLANRWCMKINDLDDFFGALQKAHDLMERLGARASDHGIYIPYGQQVERTVAERLFAKARSGERLTTAEVADFKAFFLNEVAEMDAKSGWVFQLHFGVIRDVRKSLWDAIGADAGGDIADHDVAFLAPLMPFLNRFDGRLKTVLYNMSPVHNATLAALTRAFGSTVCLGPAWWLNDSYEGMHNQFNLGGSIDLISNMTGMVSDSRKILSYGSRFELYRRTLAETLAAMANRGQMPASVAKKLARRLAYDRPKEFFGF